MVSVSVESNPKRQAQETLNEVEISDRAIASLVTASNAKMQHLIHNKFHAPVRSDSCYDPPSRKEHGTDPLATRTCMWPNVFENM